MEKFQVSRVEGRTLHPLSYTPLDFSKYKGRTFASWLLERVAGHLKEQGDREWIINGARRSTGGSRVLGAERYNLADVTIYFYLLGLHIHLHLHLQFNLDLCQFL